ncbi:hypothetical protein BCR44DRAFT_1460398 [Catenaria anguillulae PL171]|uniref:G-protein coupled receptors family 3 profile domain-containing protein n=1 Tax=Catenaria anguillulae PL171 TaxID=765915 RepID=A0A1Y2HNY9_9FUNG|nr:hypothetical protein BCR44DRAFT_1460398 [Catenaria anguillulae PL171]
MHKQRQSVSSWAKPWASTLPLRRLFLNQTGIWVEFDAMGTDDTSIVSAAIALTLRNRDPSIDMVVLDVVWTGQYADDLLPLQDKLNPNMLALHNEQNVAAGRVMGNLFVSFRYSVPNEPEMPRCIPHFAVSISRIAVPQQADYGLLYVRNDLLRKHGFSSPPKTMDQLGVMLDTIVPAERRSNPNFIGYIGQLKPPSYEGFMCNIMEMLRAESAGSILESNRTLSSTDLTASTGQRVLTVAHRWNAWNRKGYLVTGLDEWHGMLEFAKGNTLFHRNWPFVVAQLAQRNVSFEWQVAQNPEAAVKVAEFLMSPEFQRLRLVHAGTLPTVKAMYNDSEVCTILQGQCDLFRTINIAHRPSGAAGSQYAEVSRLISMHWTNLVTDLDSPPTKLGEHLKALNRDLGTLLDIDIFGEPSNISPLSPIAIAFESAAALVILMSAASLMNAYMSRQAVPTHTLAILVSITITIDLVILAGFTLANIPTPIHTDLLESHYIRCGTHSPTSSTLLYSLLLGYHGIQVVVTLFFAFSARRLVHLPKHCKHELNLLLTSLVNAVVVATILVPLALLDYVDQVAGFQPTCSRMRGPCCAHARRATKHKGPMGNK